MRLMEGTRRSLRVENVDQMEEIKKGPWKFEEDQVLINHVRKYGPRDWSSIRSKGLLQRTGKSCRLRWVNKLRPNLKNGVKFSADEERTVIELQEKFGNKWAKIATSLPGRTDNDVKNFWSSRQKRLARIVHNTGTSSSRPSKNTTRVVQAPAFQQVPSFLEAPKFSSSTEEELRKKSQSSSTSHQGNSDMIKMVPIPEPLHTTYPCYEQTQTPQNYSLPEKKPSADPRLHLSFPQIFPEKKPFADPQLHFSFPQISLDFPMPSFGDPNYVDVFGHSSGSALGTVQFPIMPSFFGPDRTCLSGAGEGHNAIVQDTFTDDFPPIDIFDPIEPLPSPSEWS